MCCLFFFFFFSKGRVGSLAIAEQNYLSKMQGSYNSLILCSQLGATQSSLRYVFK